MQEISGIEDEWEQIRRFELSDGRRIDCPAKDIREFGLYEVFSQHGIGHEVDPAKAIEVYQDGIRVGAFPGDFDPKNVISINPLYMPRDGDFTRTHTRVIASPRLGPGDFEAVRGFMRYQPYSELAGKPDSPRGAQPLKVNNDMPYVLQHDEHDPKNTIFAKDGKRKT